MIKYLLIPFKFFAYMFSYFVPKNETLWLFGCWFGDKYCDNSKYLFEYVLSNFKGLKVYWVTKNKKVYEELNKQGKPVLYYKNFKTIWIILRAKVFVMTSGLEDFIYYFMINNKTLRIQLWHGVGNKRIGYNSAKTNIRFLKIKKLFLPFLINYRYSIVISTSDLMKDRFITSFGLQKNASPITGYPRNDIFYKQKQTKHNNYKILYAPTHRKYNDNKYNSYIPTKEILDKINSFSQKYNILFYIKLHYYDEGKISKKCYENVKIINSDPFFDIQKKLSEIDLLITDYSSIYFDFLLLDRPVIFSAFDLDEYTKNDQGMYESFESVAAGYIAKNWDEILEWILKLKENPDLYKKERKQIRDRFHKYQDGKSCERVFQEIKKLIEDEK